MAYIFGYPSAYSVRPGEALPLHISTDEPSFVVEVFQLGSATSFFKTTVSTTVGAAHPFDFPPTPQGASAAEDWQWPQNYSLPADVTDAISGIYTISLTAGGQEAVICYVVRAAPGSTNSILYKMSLATVVAYNDPPSMYAPARFKFIGGAGNPSGYKATMRRPISMPIWAIIDVYERPLVQYLDGKGYGVDFCVDVDLQAEGHALLDRYSLFISSGHDEYWSQEMRTAVETFRDNGGNVAFLSGNTCFWRIHFTNSNTAFICNKGSDTNNYAVGPDGWSAATPHVKDAELEHAFGTLAVQSATFAANSETKFTGVSTRFGGIIPDAGPDMALGYRMQFTEHWVCRGAVSDTRAVTGDRAASLVSRDGQKQGLVGYEVDGTPLALEASSIPGEPQVYVPANTAVSGTPDNFVVLGVCFLPQGIWVQENNKGHWQLIQNELVPFTALNAYYAGYTQATSANYMIPSSSAAAAAQQIRDASYAAVMGAYSKYGIVFSASTTNWNRYLEGSATDNITVQKMTSNVVECLMSRRHRIVGNTFRPGNASPRLLLQHETTDEPVFWTMQTVPAPAVLSRVGTGSIHYNGSDAVRSGWKIVGSAAILGRTYVFFQKIDGASNIVQYWWLDAQLTPQGTGSFEDINDPVWRVAGFPVLDPNAGDPTGTPQLLLQNQSTGELLCWVLGAQPDGLLSIERQPFITLTTTGANFAEPTWRAVATPDVYRDGTSDILLQRVRDPNNPSVPVPGEGDVLFAKMNDFAIAAQVVQGAPQDELHYVVPQNPGSTDWSVVGTADLTGDGVADILFQNVSTGEFRFWVMAFSTVNLVWSRSRDVTFAKNPWTA